MNCPQGGGDALSELRSVRRFKPEPVPVEELRALVGAALLAPTSRAECPWRIGAVFDPALRQAMRQAVAERLEQMLRWSTNMRRRGTVAFDYFSAFFPEDVVRAPDPRARMHDHALAFAGAPVVLALSVSPLPVSAYRRPRIPGMGSPLLPDRPGPPGVRHAARMLLRALRSRLLRSLPARRVPPPVSAAEYVAGCRPDLQSLGAAMQNLLLAAHARGYGGCWMTSPLIAGAELERLLGIQRPWQLAALLPLGVPDERPEPGRRAAVDEVLTLHAAIDPT